VPAGGTTGQVLAKNSNTDFDTGWINAPSGGGEANTASNVGTAGVGLFKEKSGVELGFKKLKAGANVTITATANDEVEIASSANPVSAFTGLVDAATIAVDASLGRKFTVTLQGNRTLGNPSNLTDGQLLLFEFIQDGAGSRTLSLDTKFAFGSDITSVALSTGAAKRDYMLCVYRSTPDKLYVIDFVKGY
jgi:hypothetical protein